MRRANGIRLFLHIGALALTFRKHWARSRAVKPLIVFVSVAGVLSGCSHESPPPSKPPAAVRLATVAASEMNGEALRYSASVLPYAQVDLMFHSSGYVTNISQVQGAEGRARAIGMGDYAQKNLTLAHIR